MNVVILMGRLTSEPEVRFTQGTEPVCIARYTIAVDNGRKDKDGRTQADFVRCVAFGKNAEFAQKYMTKGKRFAVNGRWQTGSYTDKEGHKVRTDECYVERQEFADGKGEDMRIEVPKPMDTHKTDSDGFMHIPDGIQEELPFA